MPGGVIDRLGHHPPLMIIGVGHDMLSVGRHNHPVLAVPEIVPAVACGGHVAVQIVLGLHDHAVRDVGVLVQRVGKIVPPRAVVGRRQAVAYRIVGIAVVVRAHELTNDFGTDVVPGIVRHGQIIDSPGAPGKRIVVKIEA